MKNSYIIGDIHGCYNTLLKLVDKLPKDAKLIFVGDLCDKGNFSKEVISFVKDNNHLAVKGNHEVLMQTHIEKAMAGEDSYWNCSDIFGGDKTVRSYEDSVDVLKEHLEWIDKLPIYLEIENYFITHGYGLPYYSRKDDKNYERAILSNRVDIEEYRYDWEDVLDYEVVNVFGHCAFDEVKRGTNYIGIDTGCVYGRKLTALSLETGETVDEAVDSRDIE